jgi:hypothetical protein
LDLATHTYTIWTSAEKHRDLIPPLTAAIRLLLSAGVETDYIYTQTE